MSDSDTVDSSSDNFSSGNEALRQMYRITADYDRPFDEKLSDLLRLGRAYLDVESGFLTEITDGTQLIVKASGNHELLQSGASCPLSKAYCRKTIDQDRALTVQHAKVEGWEGDAAYEEFGLESYIGSRVVVDGEVYGTFCFAGMEPRDRPFSEDEETFVELMAEWVSYELFQQRATERIKNQRDQLEEFTSVVSHDLRNPLSVIDGYLDLAEKTGDPEHFDRCHNAVDRMGILIDDLLVLAREGNAIAETETVDVSELVEECWSFIRAEEATLKIKSDMVITGDWSRLQQLFENLFRNAIEHGGKMVTVTVGMLKNDTGIYIADDGPGFPDGVVDQIFNDGFSTSKQGTGFGLTIVEQVVEAHGWKITATEATDGGSQFEITEIEFQN